MTLPDPARYAMDAARAIGAEYADLDQGGGYLWRISRNGRSVLGGAGGICTFPINSATAFTLSRDKSHTKSVLNAAGLPVIPGGLFFAHQRRVALRSPGREIDDAAIFAKAQGYPVFCKPNFGARGNFAEIVRDETELRDYAGRVAVEFESFLIEPMIRGAEHRVLVHDGRPVFHSVKSPPALLGDGVRSLAALLEDLNRQLTAQGVSTYPPTALHADPDTVPPAGARIPLPGRHNLSAIGDIAAFSVDTPAPLARLAIASVAALGLRIGAVDMFDVSPAGDLTDLLVIEVNGNPGLRTLELAGRSDLIRAIWVSMLSELLET